MPKGGLRPRKEDGSLDHSIEPKWKSGKTRTIRVPEVLANQLLQIGRRLDAGEDINLLQGNKIDIITTFSDLSQDNKEQIERLKASQAKARALLQKAIASKSKGGSYAANNAAGIRKLVEQALKVLNDSLN